MSFINGEKSRAAIARRRRTARRVKDRARRAAIVQQAHAKRGAKKTPAKRVKTATT